MSKIRDIDKFILIRIYLSSLSSQDVPLKKLMPEGCPLNLEKYLSHLEEKGYIKTKNSEIKLTALGRSTFKVVFTGGVYDILHVGHLKTLEEARKFGDTLVVVVARDITVLNRKRKPINSETDRLVMLNSLKLVDIAILGHETNHLESVKMIDPDIIAIGADQHHIIEKLKSDLDKMGLKSIEFVKLKADLDGISTTTILDKIRNAKL